MKVFVTFHVYVLFNYSWIYVFVCYDLSTFYKVKNITLNGVMPPVDSSLTIFYVDLEWRIEQSFFYNRTTQRAKLNPVLRKYIKLMIRNFGNLRERSEKFQILYFLNTM